MDINQKKNQIQQEALETHRKAGGFSTLAMATGVGKSRCGVLRAKEIVEKNPNAKILLACFTTDQRDNVWRLEFDEWGATEIYEKNIVERVCYVSLGKIVNMEFDLVLMDESHHITEACLPFFETCTIHSILALTATPPTDTIKKQIINAVAPISFIYPLEQAIKDGVVAPFIIDIIYTDLEKVKKTVQAGSKAKPFMQTEKSAYDYWDNAFKIRGEELKEHNQKLYNLGWSDKEEYFNKALFEKNKEACEKLLKQKSFIESQYLKAMSKRANIIYNSFNKTRIAKRFIEECVSDDYRYLFFAGSIKQSNEILPEHSFNSESGIQAYNAFMNLESNKLCVVKSLDEGSNIKDLDFGFVNQVNSKELQIIQRIGRVIRIRPNHVGKIIIQCVRGTQDLVWLKSALRSMKFIKISEFDEEGFFEKNKQLQLEF